MAFFPRMLKTLKLLAITPLATVLWFGVLGGMVWRLEPDEFGRDGYGSQVGNWIHNGSRRSPRLVSPSTFMYIAIGNDGKSRIRSEGFEPLGLAKFDTFPSLMMVADEKYPVRATLEVWHSGERGMFAHTESYWPIYSFGSETIQDDSYRISPEILSAIESDGRSSGFARDLRMAMKRPVPIGGSSSVVELTRPLWSGYIYNGVMVVLLLAGLHSMRWVYRGVPLRQLRQVWRPDEECTQCGYSLTGLNTAKCPECGKELKTPDADQEAAAC